MTDRTLPEDEHTHPSPAHRAACPVCHPDKTVPELNEAYRQEVRYQQSTLTSDPNNSVERSAGEPETAEKADIPATREGGLLATRSRRQIDGVALLITAPACLRCEDTGYEMDASGNSRPCGSPGCKSRPEL